MPGIEISLEALTERGARLPKIDLAPPRSVIGKNTIDAIRSGVVYGYAGAIDAILRRLYDELGERADVVATGGLAEPRRALHRGDRRGRRPAHAHRAAAALRAQQLEPRLQRARPGRAASHAAARPRRRPRTHNATDAAQRLTDSWTLGPLQVPNRVMLAPLAGIGNWFVRLQAKRYGAGMAVSEMVSSHAIHHGNEKTCDGDAAHRPARARRRAGRSRSSCSARTPSHARRRRARRRAAGADAIDLNMGCPVPKVCKTGAGAALLDDPDRAVAVARAGAARAAGLPVTVKLRSGPARRRRRAASSSPTGSSTRPAWRRSRFHPRSAAVHHKGAPDYELAARLVADAAGAGDPHRRPERRRQRRARAFEQTGAAAVMLARGALGNPWLFERAARHARRASRRARRFSTSSTG